MSDSDFVELYQTNRPHEIMMVLNALKERGLPAFGQERSVTGNISDLPMSPVAAPGISWVAMVSRGAEREARALLHSLPLAQPVDGTGSVAPRGGERSPNRMLQWSIAVILVLALAAYLSEVWTLF